MDLIIFSVIDFRYLIRLGIILLFAIY